MFRSEKQAVENKPESIVMEFGLQVRGSNPSVQQYPVPLKAQTDRARLYH
jgi:hypothetical protein